MRPILLVTNDDGIESRFLQALCDAHKPHFHVCVAAPQREQSWVGRSFSRLRNVAVEPRSLPYADEAWAIDGTPSDCVNIALGTLLGGRRPTAVISGINIGYNITMPLCLSSGTLAGALEGAAWDIPALAFSLELPDSEYRHAQRNKGEIHGIGLESLLAAAKRAAILTRQIIAQTPETNPSKTNTTENAAPIVVHNINFPRITTDTTPVENTTLATVRSGSLYFEESPNIFRFRWNKSPHPASIPPNSDAACILRGNISHTQYSPA